MLRTKLFWAFLALFFIVSLLAAVCGIRLTRSLIAEVAVLLLAGVAVAGWLACVISSRLAAPLDGLTEAARLIQQGQRPGPLPRQCSCREVDRLVDAFNAMSETLRDREDRLAAARAELERTNENLNATNRNYMETLGFVSHELRNPLSTMMNYVYLLKGSFIGPITEKQQRAVAVIEANTNRLVEMVRHYLNLARIENGELQPLPGRVALLADVIQPLLETMIPDLDAQGMTLDNRLTPDIVLHADSNMVREVFENLISNAVKYGRAGGPLTLSATREAGFYRFAVRNEGEGIPADRLVSVFQKFSRFSSPTRRHQKGTGLGLFITRAIVEAHGGTIEVESHPNAWTEFRFALPAGA